MDLFQSGKFKLHGGANSTFKVECDALTDGSAATLCQMARDVVGPFSSVEGVPRGGLRLAKLLLPYCVPDGPHLTVDDVLTTGGSLWKAKRMICRSDGLTQDGRKIIGVVLFARGKCPDWVRAVNQMPEQLWTVRGDGWYVYNAVGSDKLVPLFCLKASSQEHAEALVRSNCGDEALTVGKILPGDGRKPPWPMLSDLMP